MITGLSANFETELARGDNKPSVVVQLQEDIIAAEESTSIDWGDNTAENNVDYTSSVGNVILASPGLLESYEASGDSYGTDSFFNFLAQGFKLSIDSKVIKLEAFMKISTAASSGVYRAKIYASDGADPWDGTLLATSTNDVTIDDTGAWRVWNIDVDLLSGTLYYFEIGYISGSGKLQWWGDSGNGYPDGTYWYNKGIEVPGFDAHFRVFSVYTSTGFIQTDEMDIGSVPTVDGEWQLSDVKPSDSALTYEAWYSTTGAFAGEEVSIGAIVDGDAITDLIRYWLVKATFTPNTTRDQTPILRAIRADFSTYKSFTNNLDIMPVEGFEGGLLSIESSTTKIDTFAASTIGNQNISFDFNTSISKYLFSKYPKNKLVRIYVGFIAPGFTFADHLLFFKGQILDYDITSSDQVRISVQNYQINWNTKVPEIWETTGDDVTWTNMHPIDILLDIFKNYTAARDSEFVLSSFADVKATIPTWQLTRTITAQPAEAKKLSEELRILMSCVFIPQADGKIKIKRFDSTEASVFSLSAANTKNLSYKGNLKSLINKTVSYYAHGEDGAGVYTSPEAGTKAEDFDELSLGVAVTSQDNWNEIARYELKDRFTRSTGLNQVEALSDDLLARYQDPPSIIQVPQTGLDMMVYEPGDFGDITTLRAPSVDGVSGISDKKYQVVQRTLDFMNSKVSMDLLEV